MEERRGFFACCHEVDRYHSIVKDERKDKRRGEITVSEGGEMLE